VSPPGRRDGHSGRFARHLGQQRGGDLGAPLAEFDVPPLKRCSPQRQGRLPLTKFLVPLLEAAGTEDAPAGSSTSFDRRYPGPNPRDLFVLGVQGRGAPVDQAPRQTPRTDHHRQRHRARTFESKMMGRPSRRSGHRSASAPLRRIGRPDDMAARRSIWPAEPGPTSRRRHSRDGGIATTR